MNSHQIEEIGNQLFNALLSATTIKPLTESYSDISINDAYHISRHILRLREENGERVIGKKIGVTSKSVQDMLNVHQPDFGFLTNKMQFTNGADISISETGLIQPRAEGEVAFMLKSDLQGPGVSRQDVLDATDWVAPCFEIVDSRIDNWKIKIQDTIADNASCGVFVIGEKHTNPEFLDLAAVRMQLYRDDEPAGTGLGSAVQGHPAEAVAWLANTLGELDIPLLKGEIILSGSLAPLVPAAAGNNFTMEIEALGGCSVQFIK